MYTDFMLPSTVYSSQLLVAIVSFLVVFLLCNYFSEIMDAWNIKYRPIWTVVVFTLITFRIIDVFFDVDI